MALITFTEGVSNVNSKIVKTDQLAADILQLTQMPKTTSISIGDEVTYIDQIGNTLFKGLVQDVKNGNTKEAEVWDYSVQLQDRTLNAIYNSKSPEYIIEDIVNNYTDMTFVSTISSGVTISQYKINDQRAWDVVTEMVNVLQANFRVDYNKNFYLELEGENFSTKIINNTIASIDGSWISNKTNLVNSVIVTGQRQNFQKTETFNGDGTTVTFSLSEIPIDMTASVGGTTQVGYVIGQTNPSGTYSYTINKENKTITFDTAPPSGTGNIITTYSFSVPIKVHRRDYASISTYGQKDKVFSKDYITIRNDARKFASYIISKYKDPLLSSTWFINKNSEYFDFNNYIPNEVIPVNDTIRNVIGNYIIKQVIREYPGQLQIMVGQDEESIVFWQKEIQDRVKQLEQKDDNSQLLNEDEQVTENVTLTFTAEIFEVTRRTFAADTFYLLENGTATRNQMVNAGTGPVMREYGYTDEPIFTTYIITESGDNLITESGDLFIEE